MVDNKISYWTQYHLSIFCLIGLLGCNTPEYLSESELNSFILDQDNGLMQSISSNGVDIRLVYKPTDLLVSQEIRGKEKIDSDDIESLRAKYQDHLYFILSLSHEDREVITPAALGQGRFSDMVQTVSFRMGQFVNLTTPKPDTVLLADYVYNRTFGMSGSTDLLLVFNKEKCADQTWLQFNLKEFGLGVGNQALRFEMENILEAPKIYKNLK